MYTSLKTYVIRNPALRFFLSKSLAPTTPILHSPLLHISFSTCFKTVFAAFIYFVDRTSSKKNTKLIITSKLHSNNNVTRDYCLSKTSISAFISNPEITRKKIKTLNMLLHICLVQIICLIICCFICHNFTSPFDEMTCFHFFLRFIFIIPQENEKSK